MNQFQKRARGEEAHFANRQTEEYFAHARSLIKLGEWAAAQMGEDAPSVKEYAEMLVRARIDGKKPRETVIYDLRKAGREDKAEEVQSKFQQYLEEARRDARL